MDLKEKMELLETIMELEMELDGLEEWDSLSKLSLMAEVRKRMGKTISVDEIKGFVTVQDICDYLE